MKFSEEGSGRPNYDKKAEEECKEWKKALHDQNYKEHIFEVNKLVAKPILSQEECKEQNKEIKELEFPGGECEREQYDKKNWEERNYEEHMQGKNEKHEKDRQVVILKLTIIKGRYLSPEDVSGWYIENHNLNFLPRNCLGTLIAYSTNEFLTRKKDIYRLGIILYLHPYSAAIAPIVSTNLDQ